MTSDCRMCQPHSMYVVWICQLSTIWFCYIRTCYTHVRTSSYNVIMSSSRSNEKKETVQRFDLEGLHQLTKVNCTRFRWQRSLWADKPILQLMKTFKPSNRCTTSSSLLHDLLIIRQRTEFLLPHTPWASTTSRMNRYACMYTLVYTQHWQIDLMSTCVCSRINQLLTPGCTTFRPRMYVGLSQLCASCT